MVERAILRSREREEEEEEEEEERMREEIQRDIFYYRKREKVE